MKNSARMRYVSEIPLPNRKLRARPPLTITEENRRRFVRLEISAPMYLRRVKDTFGNYWPAGSEYPVSGSILNVSAGGLLAEFNEPLHEGDIVAMRFTLEDLEAIEGVLGIVKRCDRDGASYLSGIEFTSRQKLSDRLSAAEMDLLSTQYADFSRSIENVLGKYIYEDEA